MRPPRGSDLVRDLAAGSAEAKAFFEHEPGSLESYRARVAEVDGRIQGEARTRWADSVRALGERSRARLDAVLDGNGYLVTTGQQPGLFGGPLYSLYKGLTAARLADALEAVLDAPVAALFWTASEDHDWAEADHAHVIGTDNELHRLQLPAVPGAGSLPLHRIPMGPGVTEQIDRCRQLLPDTDLSNSYLEWIATTFRPDATLPEAFEAWLARWLEPLGVLFVQAHAPALKAQSLDLLLAELEGAADHERELGARAEALERAGYGVQVPILEGGVNLFFEGPEGRERLYRDEGRGFRLRHSGTHLTAEEIRARAAADPEVLSPNVLLRPVVESSVFPSLAYVAGPGEIAYFGQLQPLFRALGVGMPVVFPRLGATVVEGKIRKVLEKFELELEALERPYHELASDFARDEVPADVQRALGSLRGELGKGIKALSDAARAIDPTLKGPIQHARSVALDALADTERKILQAIKRESEIALSQVQKAQLHLYPDGAPQERILNAMYYLVRYGSEFADAASERFAAALPRLGPND